MSKYSRLTRRLVKVCLGIVLCCAPAVPSPGQGPRELLIQNWTREQGLPGSTVTSLAQTADGYVWLGTFGGLVCFDGVKFLRIELQKIAGLRDAGVTCLGTDQQGALWIGTEEGRLLRYYHGVFTSLEPPSHRTGQRSIRQVLPGPEGVVWTLNYEGVLSMLRAGVFRTAAENAALTALAVDNSGGLWLAAGRELLNRDGEELRGRWGASRESGFQADTIAPARQGGCWVGGNGRVRRFDAGRWHESQAVPSAKEAALTAILEDRQGNLWVATYGDGILRAERGGRTRRLDRENGLPSNLVRCLLEDREGNIWAGLEGKGLARIRSATFAGYGRAEGLSGETMLCACSGANGEIWVGGNGSGVECIQDGQLRHYGQAEGLTNLFVWALHCDHSGTLWAGTWGGGLFRLQGERFVSATPQIGPTPIVLAIHSDRKGTLWLGQRLENERRIDRFEGGRRLVCQVAGSARQIDARCLAETRDGTIWCGTTEELLRGKAGVFTRCDAGTGLPQGPISSLHVDDDGALWIAVAGFGLVLWEKERFSPLVVTRTLLDDNLNQITDDGLGHLWCGLRSGVVRLDKQELRRLAAGEQLPLTWQHFSQSDGLPANECSGAGCRGQDGRIWFPTAAGVAVVDPRNVGRSLPPPGAMVEEVLLGGKPVSGGAAPRQYGGPADQPHAAASSLRAPAAVTIPPGGGQLEIAYTAPEFSAPERLRFRYQLAGLEGSRVEAGSARVARYSYLPPGKYEFQVTTRFEGGPWNDSWARLPIEVMPHYWQTGWFEATAIGALLLVAVGSARFWLTRRFRRRLAVLEQQHALEAERSRIAQDLHDDLGTSLTEITFLSAIAGSPHTSGAEVNECLENIRGKALESVKALDEIVWAVNPRNDSLRNLVNYLCLFAQEFLRSAAIQCRLEVPQGLPELPLNADQRHTVFLVTKEALANAAKHARATEVWLKVFLQDSRLTLVVSDNGCGFDTRAARPDRNGLNNIELRMRRLGGSANVLSTPGQGTRVELQLPLP